MRSVHVVVPAGIDDPATPSGGNTYDRKVCRGLEALGWSVHQTVVPWQWRRADPSPAGALRTALGGLADGAVVLVDGLVGSTLPEVLVPEAARLRLVVLVHLPAGLAARGQGLARGWQAERDALGPAAAVLTTSAWTRRWLLDHYGLQPGRVHVAEPGVDPADPAPGTASGGQLLCVAAVVPGKGHTVLVEALGAVADLPWHCRVAGTLARDPAHVERLTDRLREAALGNRVSLVGTLAAAELGAAYAGSDLLVVPSVRETYGMVVTEALARALPVVATRVGGLPEALGRDRDGARPGLLVRPDDPTALAAALRCWLVDEALRRRLRSAAAGRRGRLVRWEATSRRVARVLAEASA